MNHQRHHQHTHHGQQKLAQRAAARNPGNHHRNPQQQQAQADRKPCRVKGQPIRHRAQEKQEEGNEYRAVVAIECVHGSHLSLRGSESMRLGFFALIGAFTYL